MHRCAMLIDHVVAEMRDKTLAGGKRLIGGIIGIDADGMAIRTEREACGHVAAGIRPHQVGDVQDCPVVDVKSILQQVDPERTRTFTARSRNRRGNRGRVVGAGDGDGSGLVHRRAMLVDHVVAEMGSEYAALGKVIIGRVVGVDQQ